mgnify:CR=1 FL=1
MKFIYTSKKKLRKGYSVKPIEEVINTVRIPKWRKGK